MSKPQVINVPAGAGIGTMPPVQLPLGGEGAVTLFNLSQTLGLTLCNDQDFMVNTTWPLQAGNVIPQTGIDNLWAQNSNTQDVQILVLEGVVPVSLFNTSGLP